MPMIFHRHRLPLFDFGKVLLRFHENTDYIEGNLLFCRAVCGSVLDFNVL